MKKIKGKSPTIAQMIEVRDRKWMNSDRVRSSIQALEKIKDVSSLHKKLEHNEAVSDSLKETYSSYNDAVEEWGKYIVVSSVSLLEVYVKSVYKHLVDDYECFIENLSSVGGLSLSLSTAIELKKNEFTLGDLASHSISASNYRIIKKNVGMLLGLELQEFEKEIKKIYRENLVYFHEVQMEMFEQTEEGTKDRINRDFSDFFRGIGSIIDFRHIICHEGVHEFTPSEYNIIKNAPTYVGIFIHLTEELISKIVRNSIENQSVNYKKT